MSVRRRHIRVRRHLPGQDVDGADGGTGDVSILQRFEVQIKILDIAETVGQRAQQFREVLQLGLRLGHADRFEAKATARRGLREAAEVGRDHN